MCGKLIRAAPVTLDAPTVIRCQDVVVGMQKLLPFRLLLLVETDAGNIPGWRREVTAFRLSADDVMTKRRVAKRASRGAPSKGPVVAREGADCAVDRSRHDGSRCRHRDR